MKETSRRPSGRGGRPKTTLLITTHVPIAVYQALEARAVQEGKSLYRVACEALSASVAVSAASSKEG